MIVIASSRPEVERILLKVFQKYAPECAVTTLDAAEAQQATTAACWFPDLSKLRQLPKLELIHSIAAGVEHLDITQLQDKYRICRVLDSIHQQGMLDYVLWGVLYVQRYFDRYVAQAKQQLWQQHRQRSRQDLCVGVMGLGHMGGFVAQGLAALGYQVRGWSDSIKPLQQVENFTGQAQLTAFLAPCDVVVNLLPLTAYTEAIFNQKLLAQFKQGAALIHCGRGQHIVENDLIAALDNGQLSTAILDAFEHEPLPADHPYWQHARIMVTPHIASHAPMSAVVAQIIDNHQRLQHKQALRYEIDVTRGY